MTPEAWREWLGTPGATRLINQLWPDAVMYCRTPECGELAGSGTLCVSCEQFDQELTAIRQRALHDATVTAYLRRTDWTAI